MKRNILLAFLVILNLVVLGAIVFVLKTRYFNGDDSRNDNPTENVENSAEETSSAEMEEYYRDNSEELIEVIDAKQSKDIPSESEVVDMLRERGFSDCMITTQNSLDGDYYEEKEISEKSSEKHPMYLAYYMTERGDLWVIHVINGKLFAYPASILLNSELQTEVIVSETKEITSYDYETNRFYVTIPKESAAIAKTVDRIDASTLGKLTLEEISKNEN